VVLVTVHFVSVTVRFDSFGDVSDVLVTDVLVTVHFISTFLTDFSYQAQVRRFFLKSAGEGKVVVGGELVVFIRSRSRPRRRCENTS
jgi:hypothetical protein